MPIEDRAARGGAGLRRRLRHGAATRRRSRRYLIQDWAGLPASAQIGSRDALLARRRSTTGPSSSASASRARRPTRSPRCGSPRSAARRSWWSRTSSAARSPARPMRSATCRRAPRWRSRRTKAFVTQVLVLQMIALHLARLRGTLSEQPAAHVSARRCASLPRLAAETLRLAPQIKKLAQRCSGVRDVIYIGRGAGLPDRHGGRAEAQGALLRARRGIRRRRAEAWADRSARPATRRWWRSRPRGAIYEKVVSNVAEARAREAPIIAVATEGDEQIDRYAARRPVRARDARGDQPGDRHPAAPAARLRGGRGARHRRRPAAQPGQVGDGRVGGLDSPDEPPRDRDRPDRHRSHRRGPGTLSRPLPPARADRARRRATVGHKVERIAGRWAAKEAISKVLGLGVRGVGWREIEILPNWAGAPQVRLHGRAARARRGAGPRRGHRLHLARAPHGGGGGGRSPPCTT